MIVYTPENKEEEADMSVQGEDKTQGDKCLPQPPTSILTPGTGFQLFIDWILYGNSMTVSFIPNMTLFWCNPSNKKRAFLWPLALVLGGLWVAALMYCSVWFATAFGDTNNLPGEVTGLVFLGPLLAATDLVHLASEDRKYLWGGVTEDILADCVLGMAVPAMFSWVFKGYTLVTMNAFNSGLLCLLLLIINIAASHLVTLVSRFRAVRMTYAVIMFAVYPLIFLPLSVAAFYHIFTI